MSNRRRHRLNSEAVAKTLSGMSVAAATTAIVAATGTPFAGVAAVPLNAVAHDLIHRVVSDRQRARVVTVVEHAARVVAEAEQKGAKIRSDGFFEDRDGRWTATEAAEAVLIAASNTPQELKLPHLGHMLAFFTVVDALNPSSAGWLLKQAEELTWTQYVLLAAIANRDITLPDREIVVQGGAGRSWDELFIADQLQDLGSFHRALIYGGERTTRLTGTPIPGGNMSASKQNLTNTGRMLSHALDVESIGHEVQMQHVELLENALSSPPAETQQAHST